MGAAPARAPIASSDEAIAQRSRHAGGSVAQATQQPQRPTERPGLATLWGETRESPVSTTTFVRASNEPWSTVRIQYDDEHGILSHTGLSNISSLGPNLVETPNGAVTVQLINGEGAALPGLTETSRAFVVGQHGERYGIRVSNRTGERFEVVATVDGLDVLDGKLGSFVKRGYLLDAFSSVDIDGFRRSTTEVAAFRFGSVKDSYAARTSGDRNVGVIGVAVFREYHPIDRSRIDENRRRDDADPFPRRFAAPPPAAPVIRN
jgi:hypothetical protein